MAGPYLILADSLVTKNLMAATTMPTMTIEDLLDRDRPALVAVLRDAVLDAGEHGQRCHLESDVELQHRWVPFWLVV